ncbi:DUF4880 domain-containing protein [Pseudomonas qingdaonensis]|nr:DUF4880 domain-containing protein [Pseudomonas qingdaonensis]
MNLPAATLRKAAEWLVRLDDSASAGDQQAFEAWLASDPQHLEAVRQLQGSLAPLRELPRAPAARRSSALRRNPVASARSRRWQSAWACCCRPAWCCSTIHRLI